MKWHPINIVVATSASLAIGGTALAAYAATTHRKDLLTVAFGAWIAAFLVSCLPLAGFVAYTLWSKVRTRRRP